MKHLFYLILLILSTYTVNGQVNTQRLYKDIPLVYSNITPDSTGRLHFNGFPLANEEPFYQLNNVRINPTGSKKGIVFDFKNIHFQGTIYYGLFPKNPAKYPQAVFFRISAKIIEGRAQINISELKGKYDIADWEKNAKARLGYRIVNQYGKIIYDGKINIEGTGPFKTSLSIVEGPFLNQLTDSGVSVSFRTNTPCSPSITVNGKEYSSPAKMMNMLGDITHEIRIDGLTPDTEYAYTVHYGDHSETHSLKTATPKGSRTPFVFAFTSDSRAGNGGGERNIYGTNAYVMKKMAALAAKKGAAFFQFTGDMINGYSSSIGETNLQYANWKRNIEPFWHHIPFNIGMGNHEALVNNFDDGSQYGVQVDKWPFDNNSAEAIFADNFYNPLNGPESEDGSSYDLYTDQINFPPYSETVYHYTYGNVGVVVLNSNYWYAPAGSKIPEIGGNPHGYIMDNQLEWLENVIEEFEKDEDIDHVFVTIHTPAFPNGGHSGDDMWYGGNNRVRPTISGQPVNKGILERRDAFLHILINKSEKVVALLSGDEHNYSRMKLTRQTPIYPEDYYGRKLKVKRPFWQITNGSAGAPYYGQEELPWSKSVEKFSIQYALMLFYIDGEKVTLTVTNPDTLEEIEEVVLKE